MKVRRILQYNLTESNLDQLINDEEEKLEGCELEYAWTEILDDTGEDILLSTQE